MGKAKKAVKKTAKKVTKKVTKKAPKKVAPSKKSTPIKSKKIQWEGFLTPLDDRLIVQLDSHEKRTAGGLYIPETSAVSGQFRGTVLAVGRGHRSQKGHVRPMDVKAGDQVVFEEYAGAKATLHEIDVRIMRESEILGIVEK